MISVVCVFNNREKCEKYLLSSLKMQRAPYELILLDNTKSEYPSAASALNVGGGRAQGDYILFIHQDMQFDSETWLSDMENILRSLQDIGIAGLAGKTDSKGVISNIMHGVPPRPAGDEMIQCVETAQTVDECALIIPKEKFRHIKFDEAVCDDWHLYGVEYSLSVIKINMNVFVLPLVAYHGSAAYSMSDNYYKTMRKVIKKHKMDHKIIYTTMGDWRTNLPLFFYKRIKLILYKKFFQ